MLLDRAIEASERAPWSLGRGEARLERVEIDEGCAPLPGLPESGRRNSCFVEYRVDVRGSLAVAADPEDVAPVQHRRRDPATMHGRAAHRARQQRGLRKMREREHPGRGHQCICYMHVGADG